VLHDERSGQRHRAWPGHYLWDRAGTWRSDRRVQSPRWRRRADRRLAGTPVGEREERTRADGQRGVIPGMIDETFLTTEEVLEYLQVNLRTVYRLIKAGKIPAVRVGRQWRFRKRDIDAWLDTQRPRGDRAPADAAAARPRPRDAGSGVLVVDDESSIRELLQKTLALAEYDVDTAPDGRAALERLRLGNYDLLIADLKMR